MQTITCNQPNKDQIDCFIDDQWCGLLQKTPRGGSWYLSAAERDGKALNLSRGTKFADGRYFFSGTIEEAKEALAFEVNA